MTLTRNVKKEAERAGFGAVGVSNLDMLRKLPYRKIKHVGTLKTPEEALPEVKSVILMGIHAWDPVFNVVADSTKLHFNKKLTPNVPLEGYRLYYQIASSKAWKVAQFLMKKGYDSIPSFSVPLKTSAVKWPRLPRQEHVTGDSDLWAKSQVGFTAHDRGIRRRRAFRRRPM